MERSMMNRRAWMRAAAGLWPGLLALPAQAQVPEASALQGRWAGQGRFFDVALHGRHGPVPFAWQIDAEGVLSGNMGQARIPPSSPRRVRDRLHYQAVLEGRVGQDEAFDRRHLVLIIDTRDGVVLDVDFHLKRRFGLDLGMSAGNVQAHRQP